MEPLRFGIIGCGIISGLHADALHHLEAAGLAKLVVAADVDKGRVEKFGEKWKCETAASIEEVVARKDIDVVTLCTPSGLHGQMATQAAKAGKHILSEKPLDVWIDAVDEAIDAAKRAGVVYGGIFQERFSAGARKVKRAVDSGAFGEIVLACAETKWYRSQDYYNSGEWRGTWKLDAGVFSNQGIHSLDKVQWLAGEVVEVISAELKCGFHRDMEGESLGAAIVRYKNGAIGTITMTTLSYDGFPERVDVSGTTGCAMLVGDHVAHFKTKDDWQDTDDAASPVAKAGQMLQGTASDPTAQTVDGHLANILDYVTAVHEGREPIVSCTEARRAVNLLNMIYKKAGVGPYAK